MVHTYHRKTEAICKDSMALSVQQLRKPGQQQSSVRSVAKTYGVDHTSLAQHVKDANSNKDRSVKAAQAVA